MKAFTIALVHMSTINPTPEIRKSHRQINFLKPEASASFSMMEYLDKLTDDLW
ncbi:MAG: hypothetical protein ACLRIL_05125 [Fusicatenibacter saccharivorans]